MSRSFLECKSNNVISSADICYSPFVEILRAITNYGCEANIISWQEYRKSDNDFDIAFELYRDTVVDLSYIDMFSSAHIQKEIYFRLSLADIDIIAYNDLSGADHWRDELYDIVEEEIIVYDSTSRMTSGRLSFCKIFDPVVGKSVCCQSESTYWKNHEICQRMIYSRRKISELGFDLF